MKRIPFIILVCLAASCSGSASADIPGWRWTDGEVQGGEAVTEPHPSIVELGWTNVTAAFTAVPEGIAVYRSPEALDGVKAVAYIAVADLQKITWDVYSIDDPAILGTTDELRTPSAWFAWKPAPVVMNGGYFFAEGGKHYNASVAVSGGRTRGVNINYASQDWETMYYPTRGVFQEKDGKCSVGWTYWTGGARHFFYNQPAANSWSRDPLPTPSAQFPEEAQDFAPQTAIGGGPVLLKDGKLVNSWEAELFYGNGADDKMPKARHPRTAIGVTADGLLILFVCEGRGMTEGVAGLTFEEEAHVLQSLACTDALNLDGGGSSCLLVQGSDTIKESDGEQRPVASVVILKEK